MKYLSLVFVAFIFLCACKKNEKIQPLPKTIPVPPPASSDSVTKYLGHRGTGSDSWPDKDPGLPKENTYEAIVYGSQKLDGAEMDIQMSKDGTIWLWHDDKINNTLPQPDLSLPCLSDAEILSLLPSGKTINKLDDVLQWLSNTPNKIFSLDVKGYFTSCSTLNLVNYFDRMTDSLTKMISKYNLTNRVLVETDYQDFLDFMKTKSPAVETYLLAYSNLDAAINTVLNKGYKGVSMAFSGNSLNATNIKRLKDNKLKIQLWSLYNSDDIYNVLIYKPDYIQTGLLDYKQ